MRNVTRGDLRTRALRTADAENDPHISTAEANQWINDGLAEFQDFLIENAPPDYFCLTHDFTLGTGGTDTLPARFYQCRAMYRVDDSTGRLDPMDVVDEVLRASFTPADAGTVLRMLYIPSSPVLTEDTDVVDGVNGFDEYIVNYVALEIKKKKKDPVGPWERRLAMLRSRILKMSVRDVSVPERVTRRLYSMRRPYRYPWRDLTVALGYRIRGNNVEAYKLWAV